MPTLGAELSGAPLRLLPEIEQLGALTSYIGKFAEGHGWAAADTMAFTLAAEEFFANTVRHSEPAAQSVEFLLTAADGEAMAVYADDAGEFDPTAFPEVDTSLPLEQPPIGGLGIHFIRKTMSTFTYRRVGGRNVIAFGPALGAWGLGFSVQHKDDRIYVGHSGNCPGYQTALYLRPDD